MTDKLGPTREFPTGKLNPHDEGALNIGIGMEGDTLIIDFGTRVAWIGMSREQAIEFARRIMRKAGAKKVTVTL
jgi:hypothetical protein